MKKAIESFMYSFVKALFTEGNVERAMSFFAADALCTGYLGDNALRKADEMKEFFISGAEKGIIDLKCEDLTCSISNPVHDAYSVLGDFALVDNKNPYRRMKKRVILFISQREESLRIHFARFELISQMGFLEFMFKLDSVNDSLREELLRSKLRFDAAVQHTSLSVWEYDLEKKLIHNGDNFVEMHGFQSSVENVPESLIESKYVHSESVEDFKAMYDKLFAGEKMVGGVFRVQNPERTKYWWEKITYIAENDETGKPVRAIGFSTDVTEYVEAQLQLSRINLQKQALVRNVFFTAALDVTSGQVLDIDVNDAQMKTLEGIDSAAGMAESFVNNFVEPSHREHVKGIISLRGIQKEHNSGGMPSYQTDYLHLRAGEDAVWATLFIEARVDKKTGHLIANLHVENINIRKQRELKIKSDAEQDPLTKTYNRMAFKVLMESVLGRLAKGHLCIFGLIDIDEFKKINDEMGHVYGDAVLIHLVEVFKGCFRQNDIIGRLGGDEFVFLLDNATSIEFIKEKLQRFYSKLQVVDDNMKVPIGISVGIAVAPLDGNDFETLYNKADTALYTAKRSGKSRWCMYGEA